MYIKYRSVNLYGKEIIVKINSLALRTTLIDDMVHFSFIDINNQSFIESISLICQSVSETIIKKLSEEYFDDLKLSNFISKNFDCLDPDGNILIRENIGVFKTIENANKILKEIENCMKNNINFYEMPEDEFWENKEEYKKYIKENEIWEHEETLSII